MVAPFGREISPTACGRTRLKERRFAKQMAVFSRQGASFYKTLAFCERIGGLAAVLAQHHPNRGGLSVWLPELAPRAKRRRIRFAFAARRSVGERLGAPVFCERFDFFGRSKPLPYSKVEACESRSEAELPYPPRKSQVDLTWLFSMKRTAVRGAILRQFGATMFFKERIDKIRRIWYIEGDTEMRGRSVKCRSV